MFDVALSKAGAYIAMVTSSDDDYPPENILDCNTETFWASTGLFPQEFVVSFASEMNIESIHIFCNNVKKIAVYKCTEQEPINFSQIAEKELDCVEGHLQSEEISLMKVNALHLKFVMMSGYDHFVSVHKLSVNGTAVRN
jgi:heat shock protein beta-11